jgi:hypothetical protein
MVKPTREELYYCYHILDMKQSEIEKQYSYKNISRLLTTYNIPKKNKGHFSKMTTENLIDRFGENREDRGKFYDYSKVNYINQTTKITIICPLHGEFNQFPRDHLNGYSGCNECSKTKRKNTCIEKYGETTPLKNQTIKDKIKSTCIERYGVENPSQSSEIKQKKIETSLKNYGYEYPLQSEIIKQKSRKTNFKKYGVSYAMKLPEVAQKSVKTRIENNNFCKTNHSIECRDFIRNYIKQKGYELDQCAFSDEENNLYEWGYQYEGKWILYDLVVFEDGFRGNKDKIIEILEYHGPFHYKENDVIERGDEKAFPWKSKKMTIKESYEIDKLKEKFAKSLTMHYNVVWSSKYHNKQ